MEVIVFLCVFFLGVLFIYVINKMRKDIMSGDEI